MMLWLCPLTGENNLVKGALCSLGEDIQTQNFTIFTTLIRKQYRLRNIYVFRDWIIRTVLRRK